MQYLIAHYYGYGIDPPWDDDYHPSGHIDYKSAFWLLIICLIFAYFIYVSNKSSE